eukprot:9485231-Pyramimonas_sp.AAC.1
MAISCHVFLVLIPLLFRIAPFPKSFFLNPLPPPLPPPPSSLTPPPCSLLPPRSSLLPPSTV